MNAIRIEDPINYTCEVHYQTWKIGLRMQRQLVSEKLDIAPACVKQWLGAGGSDLQRPIQYSAARLSDHLLVRSRVLGPASKAVVR